MKCLKIIICSLFVFFNIQVALGQGCTVTYSSGDLASLNNKIKDNEVVCIDGPVTSSAEVKVEANGTLIILSGGTLDIGVKLKMNNSSGVIEIYDGGNVTGAGEWKVEGTCGTVTNNGTITMSGKIEFKDNSTFYNNGPTTTSGDMHMDGEVINCNTIRADGEFKMHNSNFTCPTAGLSGVIKFCTLVGEGSPSASDQIINDCGLYDSELECTPTVTGTTIDESGGNVVCALDFVVDCSGETATGAHDRYWVGGESDDWSDCKNWGEDAADTDGASIPTSETTVYFNVTNDVAVTW